MAINDAMIKPNQELRSDARDLLRGDWGGPILSCLLFSIVSSAASGVAGIGNLIIGGPLELGLASYFLLLKRRKSPEMEALFQGFRQFESTLMLYIVRIVYIVLWTMLLIIPGIVAAMRYSMAFYILHDKPELSGMEALNQSKEMMNGFEGKLFGLYLSFLGWAILCLFTLGIGFLWLFPYAKASEAIFYENIKGARKF